MYNSTLRTKDEVKGEVNVKYAYKFTKWYVIMFHSGSIQFNRFTIETIADVDVVKDQTHPLVQCFRQVHCFIGYLAGKDKNVRDCDGG